MERVKFKKENNNVTIINASIHKNFTCNLISEGMHNKVSICDENNEILAYVKSCKVADCDYYSDYSEKATELICRQLGIKCAKVELAEIVGLDKTLAELEAIERSNQFISKLDPKNQAIAIAHREHIEQENKIQKAVLSYNFMKEPRYENAKRINLANLIDCYNQLDRDDEAFSFGSINSYLKLIKLLHENEELKNIMGIKNNFKIDQNIKYDFFKIALLGFATGQIDMTKYNIDLVIVNTLEGYVLELAPLYDNGESFGLSGFERKKNFEQSDIEYYKNEVSENLIQSEISQLSIKSNDVLDVEGSAKEIADIIANDNIAKEIYKNYRSIEINNVIDKLDIGEPDFEIVSYAIENFYNARLFMIEKQLIQEHSANEVENTM